MKKTIIMLICLTIVCYTSYFLSRSSSENLNSVKSTLVKKDELKKTARVDLKSIKYVATNKKDNIKLTLPMLCEEHLERLAGMTIDEYKNIVNSKDAFEDYFGAECFKKLIKHKIFLKMIHDSDCSLLKESLVVNDGCLGLMLMMKASFIADSAQNKNIDKLNGEELAANFVKMFFDLNNLNTEKFEQNIILITHLKEMYPNDPSVLEAYLGYLLIGNQITQTRSVDYLINSTLEEFSGQSFKIDRLNILQDILKNDYDSALTRTSELTERYPREPDLAYYQAAIYWKQGNESIAKKYLDRAIAMGQNCNNCAHSLYINTKEKMRTAKPGAKDIFAISVGLNFDNL